MTESKDKASDESKNLYICNAPKDQSRIIFIIYSGRVYRKDLHMPKCLWLTVCVKINSAISDGLKTLLVNIAGGQK